MHVPAVKGNPTMSCFKHSPLLLLIALVSLSGCQTEDILALADQCEGVSALVENGEEICTRGTATRCSSPAPTMPHVNQILAVVQAVRMAQANAIIAKNWNA